LGTVCLPVGFIALYIFINQRSEPFLLVSKFVFDEYALYQSCMLKDLSSIWALLTSIFWTL